MDTITDILLTAFDSIPKPPTKDSAWKAPYELLLGAFSCLIACRGPFVAREQDAIYQDSYHDDVRMQMPQLLRASLVAGERPTVNWYNGHFALWSSGLFWNDAELRIAITFEKSLRILTGILVKQSNIARLSDAAHKLLLEREARVAAEFVKHFQESGKEYCANVLMPLSRLDPFADDIGTFNAVCVEMQSGTIMRYMWEKYNRQKHNPVHMRQWLDEQQSRLQNTEASILHLNRQGIQWGVAAAALLGWSKAYSDMVLCCDDITDDHMREFIQTKEKKLLEK